MIFQEKLDPVQVSHDTKLEEVTWQNYQIARGDVQPDLALDSDEQV